MNNTIKSANINLDAEKMYMSQDYKAFKNKYYVEIKNIILNKVKKALKRSYSDLNTETAADNIFDYITRSLSNFNPEKGAFTTWLDRCINYRIRTEIDKIRDEQSLNENITDKEGNNIELLDLLKDDSYEDTNDMIFKKELKNAVWSYINKTVSDKQKTILPMFKNGYDINTIADELWLKPKDVEIYMCIFFHFCEYFEYEYAEIADIMNISYQTVRRNILSFTESIEEYLKKNDFI